MITKYDFYGSRAYLNSVIKKIKNYVLLTEKQFVTQKIKNILTLSFEPSGLLLEFSFSDPGRNIEFYQYGLKHMAVSVQCPKGTAEICKFVGQQSKIFSDEEGVNLESYTPWLKKLIKSEYFKKKPLKDCILIFREHSLISVYNMFNIFKELGLKAENSIYYSKGDRCKNIYRIEETFKSKGYGVFVLSPFESVSKTGKSEDENILPASSKRVHEELLPYFQKARKEKLKVVICDDGGLLVTTVVDLFEKDYGDLIYGYVETTKGGMHAIKSRTDLPVTIINLADCTIKNLLNAVIGHSIVHRLREIIPNVGFRGQSVVVVGYGTLGRAIAKDMRRLGMSVYVCDIEDERVFEALTDGFPVSKDAGFLIRQFKPIIIMGCTGLDALNYKNLSQIKRDTYVATVSSNEIKQSYPEFDKKSNLNFIENYARIYTLRKGHKLTILGNGASLNLYNGEGANHSEYQPFLAAMIQSILHCVTKGPLITHPGLDTLIGNEIVSKAKILSHYLKLSNSLLEYSPK